MSVRGFCVDPLDQFTNWYSGFAVAVIVTDLPSAYSPPDVLTDPPILADTDNKYLGGSSLEQEKTASKARRSNFFISFGLT